MDFALETALGSGDGVYAVHISSNIIFFVESSNTLFPMVS